jgi:NhaP-type Na+/H+ or K+/H+ antiporter
MTFLGWMALVGGLLLLMALSSAYLRRLPVSTSAIYLAFGLAIGPFGFDLLRIDVRESYGWLEPLTEVAVIISLFVGGLKLRLPLAAGAWWAAYWLAGPVMLVCIAAVAAFAHLVLGLDFALALLVGAILAPTDPVLAAAVSVNNAADHDRLRYGLSAEAGLNDGTAFPFVVLALSWMQHPGPGGWLAGWAAHRLLWAVAAGLAFGYLIGHGVGRAAIRLRSVHRDSSAPNDVLALSVILLSYVAAEAAGAWGFLSVFAAGVGLRRAELSVAGAQAPAEHLVAATVGEDELHEPAVAAGVLVAETLSFGGTAERLLEVLLMVIIGTSLPIHWDLRALPLALAFFLVIRPLATQLLLRGTPTTLAQRWLIGWFGIRGIGSVFYLSYAMAHGVAGPDATDAAALTISVLAISVVLHGITAQPLLSRYERSLAPPRAAAPQRASDS